MVACVEAIRARKLRCHAPLKLGIAREGLWIDETDPRSNREFLVQVDARGANVALARPVRVPDVRAAASSVLGTSCAGRAARACSTAWNAGSQRLGGRN
jgi:hypothetical protein